MNLESGFEQWVVLNIVMTRYIFNCMLKRFPISNHSIFRTYSYGESMSLDFYDVGSKDTGLVSDVNSIRERGNLPHGFRGM